MVKKKIGLAGKSGSGKDVVADYICEQYGYKKIAVADGIRDEANAFLQFALGIEAAKQAALPPSFELVLESFREAVWAKPTPPEIRILLQWWGTEYRRSQDSLYWVKRLSERLDNEDFIVVSDVRTPDEIEAIQRAGGEVWFVERHGVGSVGITNHYTEVAFEGSVFDRTIKNDGALEVLNQKVDFIFREC